MPGDKPHLISARLGLRRAILRVIALKMAAWSAAILKKLTTADFQPSPMDNAFAGPVVSQGPPKHWIERVRQGAPELLRPAPPSGNRSPTPVSDALSIAPSVSEGKGFQPEQARRTEIRSPALRPEMPGSAFEKKETDHPIRLAPATRSIRSIESNEPHAGATRPKTAFTASPPREEERWPRPDHAKLFAASPQGTKRVRLTTFPMDPSSVPSEILHGSRATSRAAPPSESTDSQGTQEPDEEHWPELPEVPPPVSIDPRSFLREQERLRRLDDEQRGIYGARRILA